MTCPFICDLVSEEATVELSFVCSAGPNSVCRNTERPANDVIALDMERDLVRAGSDRDAARRPTVLRVSAGLNENATEPDLAAVGITIVQAGRSQGNLTDSEGIAALSGSAGDNRAASPRSVSPRRADESESYRCCNRQGSGVHGRCAVTPGAVRCSV